MAYSSVALPTPAVCARPTNGFSRLVAEAAEEEVGSKDAHVPSVQDHKRTSIFSGARPWLAGNAPCGGVSGCVCGWEGGGGSEQLFMWSQPGCPW